MWPRMGLLRDLLTGVCELEAQEIAPDPDLKYREYRCQKTDLVISRSAYHQKLQGFWLGECIANWTGLRTEGMKKTGPFFTDKAGEQIKVGTSRRSNSFWSKKVMSGVPMTTRISSTSIRAS